MKTIYKSSDNKLFDEKKHCINYEETLKKFDKKNIDIDYPFLSKTDSKGNVWFYITSLYEFILFELVHTDGNIKIDDDTPYDFYEVQTKVLKVEFPFWINLERNIDKIIINSISKKIKDLSDELLESKKLLKELKSIFEPTQITNINSVESDEKLINEHD